MQTNDKDLKRWKLYIGDERFLVFLFARCRASAIERYREFYPFRSPEFVIRVE